MVTVVLNETHARALARRAVAHGLQADVELDQRRGWQCVLYTPAGRYTLRDAYDIKWATIDPGHTTAAAA